MGELGGPSRDFIPFCSEGGSKKVNFEGKILKSLTQISEVSLDVYVHQFIAPADDIYLKKLGGPDTHQLLTFFDPTFDFFR